MKKQLFSLGALGLMSLAPASSLAHEDNPPANSRTSKYRYDFIMHYPGRGVIVSDSYESNGACQKNAQALQSTFGIPKQWICIRTIRVPDREFQYMLFMDMGDAVLETGFGNSQDCWTNGRKIKNYFKPLKLNAKATFKFSCKVIYED